MLDARQSIRRLPCRDPAESDLLLTVMVSLSESVTPGLSWLILRRSDFKFISPCGSDTERPSASQPVSTMCRPAEGTEASLLLRAKRARRHPSLPACRLPARSRSPDFPSVGSRPAEAAQPQPDAGCYSAEPALASACLLATSESPWTGSRPVPLRGRPQSRVAARLSCVAPPDPGGLRPGASWL